MASGQKKNDFNKYSLGWIGQQKVMGEYCVN